MRFCLRLLFCLLLCSLGAQAQEQLRVKIEPPNDALKANVEGYIGPIEGREESALSQLAASSAAQARKALEALGYYQPSIQSEIRAKEGKQPARLYLRIKPGEPVRLRKVHIEVQGAARTLAAFRLPDDERLKVGAVLNHAAYEQAKQQMEHQAQRYGFFRGAFVQQKLFIDPKAGAADIELVYDSGPRYRLDAPEFSDAAPLSPEFLQHLVPFAADTPYDSQKIADLYQALQGSGYFKQVQIDAQPAQGSEVVVVKVQVTLREPRSFSIGAGFSTDVGPRGRLGWTRHYSGSRGQSYGFDSEFSQPKQNLSLWYELPLAAALSDRLRFAAGLQNEEIASSDSSSRLLKLGPSLQQKLASGWQQVLSLNWQHEEYRFGDERGISNLVMPGISWSLLQSDNRLDPQNGYRVQFDVSMAKKGMLSDSNLLHGNLLLKGVKTLWDKHRLLARLQIGGTETDDYGIVPSSLRYYAGGDQSVRGYDYQSLSPKDANNDRVGGRYLMTRSLEYQYSFAEKWRIAAFIDQGNAFDSLKIPSLKTGVGLGLRWISPLGPLRLDIAHAQDEPKGFRLHFSMGPEL